MKILIITGIIAFITISIWLAKKSEIKPASEKIFDQQDNPINFGYKPAAQSLPTLRSN